MIGELCVICRDLGHVKFKKGATCYPLLSRDNASGSTTMLLASGGDIEATGIEIIDLVESARIWKEKRDQGEASSPHQWFGRLNIQVWWADVFAFEPTLSEAEANEDYKHWK